MTGSRLASLITAGTVDVLPVSLIHAPGPRLPLVDFSTKVQV